MTKADLQFTENGLCDQGSPFTLITNQHAFAMKEGDGTAYETNAYQIQADSLAERTQGVICERRGTLQ